MALWNSSANWSELVLWGPSVSPIGPGQWNTKSNQILTPMKRQPFYPKLQSLQPEWHLHFAARLQFYGATLGLTAAQINQGVADNLYLAYALGEWINNVREFKTSCTAILKTLNTGTGGIPFTFTNYTAPPLPTLPVGITDVLPGALTRTFDLVQVMKRAPAYTEAIGLDMGTVGPEAPPPPPGVGSGPRIKVTVVQGPDHQNGKVSFYKDGHQGIWIECRRGNGAWEFLANTTKSPYLDDRALLVAGQAEVREYRARYWDDGVASGDWCDVAKITVSP